MYTYVYIPNCNCFMTSKYLSSKDLCIGNSKLPDAEMSFPAGASTSSSSTRRSVATCKWYKAEQNLIRNMCLSKSTCLKFTWLQKTEVERCIANKTLHAFYTLKLITTKFLKSSSSYTRLYTIHMNMLLINSYNLSSAWNIFWFGEYVNLSLPVNHVLVRWACHFPIWMTKSWCYTACNSYLDIGWETRLQCKTFDFQVCHILGTDASQFIQNLTILAYL